MENILVLDEFFVQFAGQNRYCLEFLFTNDSIKEEFTKRMAEKYGEIISKNWFFKQENIYGQMHFPNRGESCFSLEYGQITGLQRLLTVEEIKQAQSMIISVAQEMGIEVKKRNATNLQKHIAYNEPLEYQYTAILQPKNNLQDSPKKI